MNDIGTKSQFFFFFFFAYIVKLVFNVILNVIYKVRIFFP